MKTYHLLRKQFLPIRLDQAWRFFSSPHNLARITPPAMKFKIVYVSGDANRTYAGQIIRYRITILPGIVVNWVTEITSVNEPYFFTDEQRVGPYAQWLHKHSFKEVAGGIEMTDELTYAIPLGWIGRQAHRVFVGRKVHSIFNYRHRVLEEIFSGPFVLDGNRR